MKHNPESKKEFVKYEVAVELKKLGFDEPCLGRWLVVKEWEEPTGEIILQLGTKAEDYDKDQCPAPLFSQAFRFFRERHGLYSLYTMGDYENNFYWQIWRNDSITKTYITASNYVFETYEEAELACLMKLIEIKTKSI
jgi:hypothetical protein